MDVEKRRTGTLRDRLSHSREGGPSTFSVQNYNKNPNFPFFVLENGGKWD
ncbi:hypothetical protein [Petrimonas sp.]